MRFMNEHRDRQKELNSIMKNCVDNQESNILDYFIDTQVLQQTSRLLSRDEPSYGRKVTKMKQTILQTSTFYLLVGILSITLNLVNCELFQAQQQQQVRNSPVSFPGVSRDLTSFCAARPSLPIDLATMVVHIKKNVSFNYKLYLFSGDHVFQTGQVIPRDDFRVHSFPVKFKRFNEFWASNLPTYRFASAGDSKPQPPTSENMKKEALIPVPSNQFNAGEFFHLVAINPTRIKSNKESIYRRTSSQKKPRIKTLSSTSSFPHQHTATTSTSSTPTPTASPGIDRREISSSPTEIRGDVLPGDPEPTFISHDVATVVEAKAKLAASRVPSSEAAQHMLTARDLENPNRHIKFDRDDQVSAMVRRLVSFSPVDYLARSDLDESGDDGRFKDDYNNPRATSSLNQHIDNKNSSAASNQLYSDKNKSTGEFSSDSILPVGSFSSFHVNLTYLVRKDFDQLEPQLIRIQVDPSQFSITQLVIINDGSATTTTHSSPSSSPPTTTTKLPQTNTEFGNIKSEDYDFLRHKLLLDSNTRITSITQIYEDWITRNFYTIVYLQRRLEEFDENNEQTIVTERLIFRGSSKALLGADQLDYSVKAAAFITEKNGLHYYLEFLTNGKFYLCAIDWTKRPFKIIDSRRFPIKSTRVQLDNEELLLCPPAVCYSNQPLDEVINYGRIQLTDKIQRETLILSSSLSSSSGPSISSPTATSSNIKLKVESPLLSLLNETNLVYTKQQHHSINQRLKARNIHGAGGSNDEDLENGEDKLNKIPLPSISLDNVIEAIKLGSSQLQVRLHLRDWVWIMPRNMNGNNLQHPIEKLPIPSISNDIKLLSTTPATRFEWHYELARRNDIKVKPDTYGYVLTGHEIDASYRVYNELYLISASHLITINYTMANETVVSTQPIIDEFFGLGSTLIDPITGAFYDRYANQIFFFKGDRYVGYDYATRKPLEEFILQAPMPEHIRSIDAVSLVSNLPVLGVLGRQHQVDGVYHDLLTDLVYIFTGMKFYTFEAAQFKNGSFKPNDKTLPPMQCINVNFLDGCAFDQAFPNPCHEDEQEDQNGKLQADDNMKSDVNDNNNAEVMKSNSETYNNALGGGLSLIRKDFNDEQQMKLRKIATTRAGLLNLLVENSLIEKSTRALEPLLGEERSPTQEKIVVYLLMAMIGLSALITIVMIVLIINWTRIKISRNVSPPLSHLNGHVENLTLPPPGNTTTFADTSRTSSHHLPLVTATTTTNQHLLSATGNYLNNQRHHHSRRHHQRDSHIPSSRSRSRDLNLMVSNNFVKPSSSVVMVKPKPSRRHSGNIDNSVL